MDEVCMRAGSTATFIHCNEAQPNKLVQVGRIAHKKSQRMPRSYGDERGHRSEKKAQWKLTRNSLSNGSTGIFPNVCSPCAIREARCYLDSPYTCTHFFSRLCLPTQCDLAFFPCCCDLTFFSFSLLFSLCKWLLWTWYTQSRHCTRTCIRWKAKKDWKLYPSILTAQRLTVSLKPFAMDKEPHGWQRTWKNERVIWMIAHFGIFAYESTSGRFVCKTVQLEKNSGVISLA